MNPVNYAQSIAAVTAAYNAYLKTSEHEDDDATGAALEALHKAKAAHLQQFQFLKRVGGEWI